MLILSPGWYPFSTERTWGDEVMPCPPSEVIATPRKAVGPMWTAAEDWRASTWLAMDFASLIGTVKAWVCVDDLSWSPDPADAAVLRPMTCPRALSSGPPESPAWMPALVRMSPVSCSEVPDSSSLAVIDWPRP